MTIKLDGLITGLKSETLPLRCAIFVKVYANGSHETLEFPVSPEVHNYLWANTDEIPKRVTVTIETIDGR